MQSPQGKKLFVFDKVFEEDTTQEGIWDYLQDSVTSFVKGYNVSILAYGQSGSGKSYTMGTSGPEDQNNPNIAGVVPRAAQALFEKLEGATQKQSGIQAPKRYSTHALPTLNNMAQGGQKNWQLKATYVEIYQEQLRDLLVDETVPEKDRVHPAIREDTKGRIVVTGLTQVTINSAEDLYNALNFGSSIRQTDATNINERSSRSHAVFSLNLVQKKTDGSATPRPDKRTSTPMEAMANGEGVVTLDSKLHFVDLAGSERLKNTGATGDRAKEGISINAGLASLGKVIAQLSSKSANAHISYRDSKLTRLLQDSLGGNAITFMVACVTPAVFHLSETLNTVHYAQRARAIQSRPEIQQSREEGDKQGVIDRLRAEVSFLREQIRHTDNADGKGTDAGRARAERLRGKEAELETQLMDMQENYNALSSRHAKLISELSKARDGETDTPLLKEAIGDNAVERVKRSNSFAEAVEQMVLEYEKTIQSLESSLSKTRSSLSSSESTLLEKETRIAYMETIQSQLQARVQKALDREANNEGYLRDLEGRIEGSNTGEERNAALIVELRKELSRLREGENGAEEYISTLEERLAEAEQDQDIMQREIDRLEHVVERQRGIGRLDNLLGELDGIRSMDQQNSAPQTPQKKLSPPRTNGMNGHRESYDPFKADAVSSPSTRPDSRDDYYEDAETRGSDSDVDEHEGRRSNFEDTLPTPTMPRLHHSPSQNDFMADKLETMTHELFELRSDHELVQSDYDKLQQKYQTALETLAKLEYGKETKGDASATPGRVSTFLSDAGMRGEEGAGDGQLSSSRSSSAELSSQEQRNISLEDLTQKADGTEDVPEHLEHDEAVASEVPLPSDTDLQNAELEQLRRLHAQQELSVAGLTDTYKSLHDRHEATLSQVEELKNELARAQNFRPQSPSLNKPYGAFRRKSEELLSSPSDRASRAFTSLKNTAYSSFEQFPDQRQSFDLNLNTVMNELQAKSERNQSLEAELGTLKKEMDAKQTLISGLSRERASLKASSNVDFSVVGQMRDQLQESENQIRVLHEQHATREQEFQEQVDNLKSMLASYGSQLPTPLEDKHAGIPGDFPQTPAVDSSRELQHNAGTSSREAEQAAAISRLQSELANWEVKHQDAMDAMKSSEAALMEQMADMEASLQKAEKHQHEQPRAAMINGSGSSDDAITSLETERARHQEIVDALQREVEDYKSTASSHVSKLQQLEGSYAEILQKVDDEGKDRDLNEKELRTHKDLVANLENQLQVHKSAIAIHQESLESLQASHSQELEELQSSMDSAEKDATERYTLLDTQHRATIDNLQGELTKAQSEMSGLLRHASAALGYETDSNKLQTQIKGLVEEGKELHQRHLKTTNELKQVQEELRNALSNTVELEGKISELKMINEEAIMNLEKVTEKEKKSSRLVDELEDQLNNNFDSHRAATNRLSTMQGEVAHQRMELERELEDQKMRNAMLEVSHYLQKVLSRTQNTDTSYSNKSISSSMDPWPRTHRPPTTTANRSHPKPPPSHWPALVLNPRKRNPGHASRLVLGPSLLPLHPFPCHHFLARQANPLWPPSPSALPRLLYAQLRPRPTLRHRPPGTPAKTSDPTCPRNSKSRSRAFAPSRSISLLRSSSLPRSKKHSWTSKRARTAPRARWTAGARSALRSRTSSSVCVAKRATRAPVCKPSRRSARCACAPNGHARRSSSA